jgi:hypothetical protein
MERPVDREALSRAQIRSEIRPLEVLHHHERGAVLERSDVGDASDMFALDADRGARFARKARHRVAVVENMREQELDRYEDVQLHVSCGDDDAHSTRAKNPFYAVLIRQHLAGLDRRRGGDVEHALRARQDIVTRRSPRTRVRNCAILTPILDLSRTRGRACYLDIGRCGVSKGPRLVTGPA